MQLVYAIGQPRNMEFDIASGRESVPSGGVVYATCVEDRAVENLDEWTFSAMTDVEFYTFKALVNSARQREMERMRATGRSFMASLRKFFARVFGK